MRHLVLDIGGVFYRGWPDSAFWTRWGDRTGLDREALEAVLSRSDEHRQAQLGRISADEAFATAGARLGIQGAVMRALAEDAYLSDFNQPFAAAVRDLKARGVPISALTNTLSTEAQLKARPEFSGLFDYVVASCDVGMIKPDPAIYRALLDRLGAQAGDVVFVDDLVGHVEAARSAGLVAIHFQSTEAVLAELGLYFPTS